MSQFHLPKSEITLPDSQNITAPKVINDRTKVFWTSEGVEHYQHIVAPELHRINQLWLQKTCESISSVSLLFESTNKILTKSANIANKTVKLDSKVQLRSKKTPPAIRKSARQLLSKHRELKLAEKFASSSVNALKDNYIAMRAKHRQLVRKMKAMEAAARDSFSYTILTRNPKPLFKNIKASRNNKFSSINKLHVKDKIYLDEKVSDGFFDSISSLKRRDNNFLQNCDHFQDIAADYHNILEVSKRGAKIPALTENDSIDLLMKMKPDVNDLFGLTPYHYIYAGPPGWKHFHLLLCLLIDNINNTVVEEVNSVYACILFKGHDKCKNSDRSYRTLSTCPVTAKALDMYVRSLNINKWNLTQSECQFQGEGSSHELASLLLTECIQHSIHQLDQPIFAIFLDAKSAFDLVQIELLIRNLYCSGTTGETLVYINNRLENRHTFLDWNGTLMGPIKDQLGLEQGGVGSSDFYKIFAQEQLQLVQASSLGVPLGPLTVSGIGQADDTLLVSNNIYYLKYLLELTKTFCVKHHVQLCHDKTKLQVYHKNKIKSKIEYLKAINPVNIDNHTLEYSDTAEHVGVIRSVTGNLPSLLSRISAHKRALGAIIYSGMARSHRGNPVASLRLQQIYGNPVLFSGLGSLVMSDQEAKVLFQHHKDIICNLQRLLPRTPTPFIYFMAGTLPAEALLHKRQLSLFSMITRLPSSILHGHARNIFNFVTQSRKSWFLTIRDLCMKYQLPHPSKLLDYPPNRDQFKLLVKKRIVDYWEQKLRHETSKLPSLQYFHPTFMSLTSAHPIWATAGASPTKVVMATQQARFLSGRYRTEALTSHWTHSSGFCKLSPTCNKSEDIFHILKTCPALEPTRQKLYSFTNDYCDSHPAVKDIIQTNCTQDTEGRRFCQFLLDCSVLPEVIVSVQINGPEILNQLFDISRMWCYSLHRERLKLLNRWRNFAKS